MAEEHGKFAIELTDKCETDQQWFAVMNFGMPTLLKEPKLLMECITRRACRKHDGIHDCQKSVADFAAEVMACLDLRVEVAR